MLRSAPLGLALAFAVLVAPEVAAAEAPDLEPLPRVETAQLEPAVAAVLSEARHRVETLGPDADAAERARAWGELGEVHDAHDLLPAARIGYRNAARLAPDEARWPYLLGHVELELGEIDAADRALLAAHEIAPDDVTILVALARLERLEGRTDEALARARSALALDPASRAAQLVLGEAALDAGDFAVARDAFVALWRSQPDATRLAVPLATALQGLGQSQAAEQVLRRRGEGKVSIDDPWLEQVVARRVGAQADLERGETAFQRGDWGVAVEAFRAATAANPGRAAAWINLGAALVRAGDVAAAREALARARELEPRNSGVLLNLAALAGHEGDLETAVDLYRQVLEIAPESIPARRSMGRVLLASGHPDAALEVFREGLGRDSGDSSMRVGELLALHALGRVDELATRLDQDLAELAGDVDVRATAVRILAASPHAALRDGARALAISGRLFAAGRSAETLELVAMSLAETGDFQRAAAAQRTALEAGAGMEAARRRRMEAALSGYERGEPLRDPGFD